MNRRVLFVDDDPNVLAAFRRGLCRQFETEFANHPAEALKLIRSSPPYAVVVSDMRMPDMDGVTLLTEARKSRPDTVRIMLTGNSDLQTAVSAVNRGSVFQFLTKPCPIEQLSASVSLGLRQYQLITAEKELLEHTLKGSVEVLVDILSEVDPRTFGKARKLQEYAHRFLNQWGQEPSWELETAAVLADIGLVTVPESVQTKARLGRPLAGPERDALARIAQSGHNLLAKIPRMDGVARLILFRDKQYDGNGFPPEPVAGEGIPVGSRILKVLRDLIELENRGCTTSEALEHMQSRPGVYDPKVLDAAFACFDVYLSKPSAARNGEIAVSLDDLQPGQILTENVETMDGTLLVAVGVKITATLKEKLNNFNLVNGLKLPLHVTGCD